MQPKKTTYIYSTQNSWIFLINTENPNDMSTCLDIFLFIYLSTILQMIQTSTELKLQQNMDSNGLGVEL